jgi:hypothetical protein
VATSEEGDAGRARRRRARRDSSAAVVRLLAVGHRGSRRSPIDAPPPTGEPPGILPPSIARRQGFRAWRGSWAREGGRGGMIGGAADIFPTVRSRFLPHLIF